MKKKATQSSKNIWVAAVSMLVTASVFSGGFFFWHKHEEQKWLNRVEALNGQCESTLQKTKGDHHNKLENCKNSTSSVMERLNDLQSEITTQQENESIAENVFIANGNVYYTNQNGDRITVAQSTNNPDNPVIDITYKNVELSPNKKFILLGSMRWTTIVFEIYDISSREIYNTKESSNKFGEWLPDNRLKITGTCGMGISCGIYESVSNKTPWIMKKIADYEY